MYLTLEHHGSTVNNTLPECLPSAPFSSELNDITNGFDEEQIELQMTPHLYPRLNNLENTEFSC